MGFRAEFPSRLESWAESGSRGSLGGVLLELKSQAEPGSRRSPLGAEVAGGAQLP